MEQHNFVKGALIGTVVGGIAALLIAPKAGKELCEDLIEGYNCINKRTHEFTDDLKERGQCLLDSINGVEHNHSANTMLIGSTVGAVIAALAALLLAPQAGSKLRKQLGDKYEEIREKAEDVVHDINRKRHNFEDKIDDWKDTFLTIIEKLSSQKNGKHRSAGMDEIVEWATLGLRLYNQFQKRK